MVEQIFFARHFQKTEWKALQSQKKKMGKSRKQRKVEDKEENEMKGQFYRLIYQIFKKLKNLIIIQKKRKKW